jgi:hypothetical protein
MATTLLLPPAVANSLDCQLDPLCLSRKILPHT